MRLGILLSVLTFALLTFGTPTPAQRNQTDLDNITPDDTSREVALPGLYICSEPNWRGECSWSIPEGVKHPDGDNTCQTTPYSGSQIVSFGPDRGVSCRMYGKGGCQGGSYFIWYPGFYSLPQTVPDGSLPMHNYFKSFECRLKGGWGEPDN